MATASRADQEAFVAAFLAACREIPSVRRASIGRRIKTGAGYEAKIGDVAYSHAAIIEFESVDGLRAYLSDALHARVGQLFWKVCEAPLVLDVELADASTIAVGELLVERQ